MSPGNATRPTPITIALVGCGEVCEFKHLPALGRVEGARVVALVDPDTARAKRVAEKFGIRRHFDHVDALLTQAPPDVVGVLTPPGEHADIVIESLAGGCHVLVEKPLALSLDDADAMIAAERAGAGRCLMGLHMRWHRLVRRARAAIGAGEVGTLESVRGVWSSPRRDEGIPGWKTRRATGGGALVELGVHLFDLWRVLGGAEVSEVFATARQGVRDDEAASVTARLRNGVIASAALSERSSHDLEIHVAGSGGRLRLACQRFDGFESYAVHETDGALGPRARHLIASMRELPGGLVRMRRLGDYGESYRGEWQHMVEVARGAAAECTLEDGRAALAVILAATRSADLGQPIRLECVPRTIAPGVRI
jgi:predicted dehydrogenase